MIKSISDRHFRLIDFLKGSCILFVILTHYAWSDAERLSYLFPFWIDMAVPVFMVISGFVGAKSFHRRGIDTFEKAYKAQTLCDRFIRYTVPLFLLISGHLFYCEETWAKRAAAVWCDKRCL